VTRIVEWLILDPGVGLDKERLSRNTRLMTRWLTVALFRR